MLSWGKPTTSRHKQTRHRHKRWRVSITCAALLLFACGCGGQGLLEQAGAGESAAPTPTAAPAWRPGPAWKLAWSSAFQGTDPLRDWQIDTEGYGWGNRQLQY